MAAEYGVAPDWFMTHPLYWRDRALVRMNVKREVQRQMAERANRS